MRRTFYPKKGITEMRKTITILALATLLVALTAGVALAAQVGCPTGPKGVCRGDEEDDNISGTRKTDRILALDGRDNVAGRNSNDTIDGGFGDDEELDGDEGDDIVRFDEGLDEVQNFEIELPSVAPATRAAGIVVPPDDDAERVTGSGKEARRG